MKTTKFIYYLPLIMSFILSSCGSSEYAFKDSLVLKKVNDYKSETNLIKVKKESLNVVVDNETINESQYEFLLPKNSKSHESVVNSMPTVHIFYYQKNQFLVVLKTDKSKIEENLLNMDRESFYSSLEKVSNIEYIIDDLEFLEERKHDILLKNGLTYLIINKKEGDIFQNLVSSK